VLACACSFGSDGPGGAAGLGASAGMGTDAGDDDADDDDDAATGGAESDDDDDDDDDDDSVDEGGFDTGSPPTNGAILELSDAPVFEFAVTGPGERTTHLFEIQNVGSTPATDIEPESMDPAFAFIGGFPGAEGTCGSELQPGADCLIEVAFSPVTWGTNLSDMVINYGNAAADTQVLTTLTGTCGGTTPNLLDNPDFDLSLQGWTATQGSWSRTFSPSQGNHVVVAGGNGTHVLSQTLDLTPWADAIATGNVRMIISGEHWSEGTNNDPHGFAVGLRSSVGDETIAYESGLMAGFGWESHTGQAMVLANSTELAYGLICQTGGSDCDGAFNDVSLQLQWP